MNKYQKFIELFDNVSGNDTKTLQLTKTQESNKYVVSGVDTVDSLIPTQVGLQVSGTLTSLAVKGRVDESQADVNLAIIDKQSLEVVDSITAAGIYVIPCEEIQNLTFELTGGSGVTVVAKLMF